MPDPTLVNAIANALLAASPSVEDAVSRLTAVFGKRWRPAKNIALRFLEAFPRSGTRPRQKDVVDFLSKFRAIRRARFSIANRLVGPPQMQPAPACVLWNLPRIETPGDLAKWLSISPTELDWFADLKSILPHASSPQLRHYHYRILRKPSGSIRLIEAPKLRLKEIQRRILREILEKIPSHPAVHGFRKHGSIQTFAAPHTGRRVILKMDLDDFFPSISRPRIQAMYRTAGYPEAVADLLGGLCATRAPRDLIGNHPLYSRAHLPQGAPSSPALSNIIFFRADCRLAGLAKAAGAEYTRYADDLAFSGDAHFERRAARFSIHVAAILLEEAFSVNHRKTRIMRQSVRQHLAGLVANESLNVRRSDFDRLKATLTNCIRHGPSTQNRDNHPHFAAHLEGRVSFVESIHAARGKRLRELFNQIRSNPMEGE